MKVNYVNVLVNKIGEEIRDEFVLQKITSNTNQDGSLRYNCVLSDKTGSINAIIWNESITEDQLYLEGKVVEINGMVMLHNGATSIQIVTMKEAEKTDIKNFIFSMEDSLYSAAVSKLKELLNSLSDPTLKILCTGIFQNSMLSSLKSIPASLDSYYCYNGGLLSLIVDKASYAVSIYENYKNTSACQSVSINYDLLIASSLLQDIGTVFIYNPFPIGSRTEKGLLSTIYTQSLEYVIKAKIKLKESNALDDNTLFLLENLILSTSKSTNTKTIESHILNIADNAAKSLSAFTTSFFKHDEKYPQKKDQIIYSKYLDNYIYRKL